MTRSPRWLELLRRLLSPRSARAGRTAPRPAPRPSAATAPPAHVVLPDYQGRVTAEYAPHRDGRADPGEVVWTWVAFEDDPARGKDRPVLVVGRDRGELLGLMLTSKDHDRDASDEARYGRFWMDVGAGAWDAQGRPSEVRLDRVLRLDAASVRREGAALDRTLFDEVVAAMQRVRSHKPSGGG